MPKIESLKRFAPLLVAAAAFISVFFTVNDQYLFDDEKLVGRNEQIRDISHMPEYFSGKIFPDGDNPSPLYRPALMMSLYINQLILGHSAFAYHAVNVALHCLAAVLLFYLLMSFMVFLPAFFASLLFAVHPIHTESVAFIINRSDMLVMIMLCCSTLLLLKTGPWMKMLTGKKEGWSDQKAIFLYTIASAACFYLALLSKETAMSGLLILILAIAINCIRKGMWSLQKEVWIGIFIFTMTVGVYTITRIEAIGAFAAEPVRAYFPERALDTMIPTVARIFKDYILLTVFPLVQKVDYSHYEISRGFFHIEVILSIALHLIALTLGFYLLKKRPLISFCIFAFYITLLPVSHIFPFLEIKAERFLYLPSVFFVVLIVSPLLMKNEGNVSKAKKAFYLLLALAYMALSLSYSFNFRSERALWSEMLRRMPQNYKAQYSVGNVYYKDGEFEKAIPYLEKTLQINRAYAKAYPLLGVAYTLRGDLEEAEQIFKKGLTMEPADFLLNLNYAVLCFHTQRYALALKHVDKALKADPNHEQAISIRVEILKRLKK